MSWLFFTVKANGGLPAMIAVNLLHLQGFLPDYSLNDPSWSVSVELGAYLLFPILIYLMFRAKTWITVLYTAIGIGILLRLSSFDPTGGMAFRWPPFDFARCVIEFGFGMLIYRAYASKSRLCVVGGDVWTWVIAALGLAALVARSDLAAVAVFPFLVLAFALNRGGPARVLSHPWLHYLGVISFSIYLVHAMFRVPEIWLARTLHPAPLPPWMALSFAVLASASILPVAALAYHAVERPGRNALNSIVKRLNRRVLIPTGAPRAAD
jgi:peptidoglycan/LPS O-acetylase OafA/YrhL